ncbi:MAG: OmpA family protein [Actinomycetota bacterium]
MRDDEPIDRADPFMAFGVGLSLILAVALSVVVAFGFGQPAGPVASSESSLPTTTTIPATTTTAPALPAPLGLSVDWDPDGTALVRGRVQSDEQRDAVVSAAEAAFGGENVDSGALVVASEGGVDADDRIGLLVAIVGRMPERLLNGTARLQDSVLTIEGVLAPGFDEDVFADLLDEGTDVSAVITLVPAPELPAFSRTYELTEDGVSLFGTVANEIERSRILNDVARLLPELVIDDALTVDEVSPTDGSVLLLGEAPMEVIDALREVVSTGDGVVVDDRLVELDVTTDAVDRLNELFGLAPIEFDTAAATIRPESEPTLDVAAQILGEIDGVALRVEGHTDSLGDEAANLELSQARAEAVVAALVERGVDPDRLEAVGFGETQPIADNTTIEGRQQNRRIEFSLLGA